MTVRDALKFTNYRSALVSNWAIGWSVFGVQSSIIPLAAAYLATGGDMSNAGGGYSAGLVGDGDELAG